MPTRRKGSKVKQQSKSKPARPSRRKVVRGLVAVAVGGSIGKARAQTTRSSTTEAQSIGVDDLAAADRVLGREYSQADRKLMAKNMAEMRQRLVRIRKLPIDPNIEPAVRFEPRLPDTKVPAGA